MPTIEELGQRVKAKYPEYADMPDLVVGQKVKTKFPGKYDDFSDLSGTPAALANQALSGTGISVSPPREPLPDALTGPLQPEGPSAMSRFGSSVLAAVNPLPAIKEWANRPAERQKAFDALHEDLQLQKNGVAAEDPRRQDAGNRMMVAQIGVPAASVPLPIGTEPAFTAANQAQHGDLAGAGGTLVGGYGVPAAMGKVASSLAKVAKTKGRGLYEGSLKIPPSTDRAERMAMVESGLKNEIPIDEGGLGKTRGIIDSINEKVDTAVKDAGAQGKTVDPEAVAGYVDRSKRQFAEQVNPSADLGAVESSRQEFLKKHSYEAPYTKVRPATEFEGYTPVGEGTTRVPQAIPIEAAQAEKRGTYRKLRDSSYGEMATATKESQKDLARGLKDKVYEQLPPEIKALGPKEKVLIDLESALERSVNREGNKQAVGIEGPIAYAANPTLGFLVQFLDRNPGLKSTLGIALSRDRHIPAPVKLLGHPAMGYRQPQDRQQQ